MKTRYLPSTLLAASSAFALTSAAAVASVCTPLQVQTTVDSHGPHITFAGQAYAQRGAAVVSGDFNGDGYEDSAFGEPGATVANQPKAGRVCVVFGSINAAAQVITQGGLPEQADISFAFGGFVAMHAATTRWAREEAIQFRLGAHRIWQGREPDSLPQSLRQRPVTLR
jgi:hypothetical protein